MPELCRQDQLIVLTNTTGSDPSTHVIFWKLLDKQAVTILTFAFGTVIALVSFERRSVLGALIAIVFLSVGLIRTTRATNSFLFLASLAAALAAGEFSLDLLLHMEALKIAPDSAYAKSYYWTNSDLGSQAHPGRHTSKKLTREGEVVYDVIYSIGQDGFRITPQKSEANARFVINFFGCSLLFGEGVNDNETLPYYINALDNGIRVKNFGWHGYGVHQALRILESPRDTRGDINFLLTSPWHADRSACVPDYSNGSPRYRLVGNGELVIDGSCGMRRSFLGPLLERSNIYQLIRFALRPSQDEQIDLYLAIIDRMKALSQTRNQRLIVGFLKAEDAWFRGHYSNQKIVERFKEMGVEMIDLTLAESAAGIPREYYIHALDKHPSAKANDVRAKLIVTYLRDSSAEQNFLSYAFH